MEKLNVLSLFDGMSCGQQALERSGIKYNKYYASEIDKYDIQVTQHNYPNTIQLGSVVDIDISRLEPIDLLIGGSPCQSFSFAGKRNGMTTTCNEEIYTLDRYLELKSEGFQFEGESYLFWEYMRILTDIRKYNPDVLFLLENVEMGAKWERVLSEAIGIYGVHINSALVSAQNRKRIYWTNIRVREEGLFGELHSDIPQPEDRGILLKDILESEVDEKYYLSDKMLNYFNNRAANFNDGKINIRNENDKATTITASCKSVDISDNFIKDSICVAMRGRNPDNPSDRRTGSPTEQRLEPNLSGKTNCLTSVQKDNLVVQINPSLESGGKQPYQQNRIYSTDGIMPALSAQLGGRNNILTPEATSKEYVEVEPGECFDAENINSKTRRGRKMTDKSNALMASTTNFMRYEGLSERHLANLKNGDEKANSFLSTSWKGAQANGMTLVAEHQIGARIRRLTPVECERLQTVDDNYTSCVSDTQRYKMLGNGWTVDVIAHIFRFINNGKTR